MADEPKSIQDELSLPILLSDRLIKLAQEAESSKADCAELAKQADRLSHKLRSAVRLTAATQSLYDRLVRRIAADVSKNLDRALTLVRKCRHGGVLRHVFAITTSADFRKASSLLESSIADVSWLLSIFDSDGGSSLSLPPIASNDPILAMIWSSIASVQMGLLRDRIDAATNLASLARDNDRNKKMIVEEGGVGPLLKLLKEGASADAQIAATTALHNLGNDPERVRAITGELAVPIIVKVLSESPMKVQVAVANLVSRLVEMDAYVQEEFGRENAVRPLVTLLAMDTVIDDPKIIQVTGKPTSIHSLVQINKEFIRDPTLCRIHHSNSSSSFNSLDSNTSRGGINNKKDRGLESPELKLELKTSCAKALSRLARGSLLNSKKITETKGLFCLAKIIEKEGGELQRNCLMAIMELASVAESNSELRRAAFKPNSPAAKAVLEQLLKVVNEDYGPTMLILAIKSIGSLARTFPAKETRIIGPLVNHLGNRNSDIATETAIALSKFACPENFNCAEHSKSIVEFDGVPPLMSYIMSCIRNNGKDQVQGLKLLCYLCLHVGSSQTLEQVRALNVLEGAARHVLVLHPELKELFTRAIQHLTLYQAGVHTHRQA